MSDIRNKVRALKPGWIMVQGLLAEITPAMMAELIAEGIVKRSHTVFVEGIYEDMDPAEAKEFAAGRVAYHNGIEVNRDAVKVWYERTEKDAPKEFDAEESLTAEVARLREALAAVVKACRNCGGSGIAVRRYNFPDLVCGADGCKIARAALAVSKREGGG